MTRPPADRPRTVRNHDAPPYGGLYRMAAAAAIVTVLLIPVQLVVFVIFPPPVEASALVWFEFLQTNRFAALVSLDVLLLLDWILLIPIYLALYVVLRKVSPEWAALAFLLWGAALAAYFGTNSALEMSRLSDAHAVADGDAERAALVAAGEALMAAWDGTAFHVSYILGQLAGILMGALVLRHEAFSRAEGWLLIGGSVLGFGLYIPVVGLALSAASGLVLLVWYPFAARSFLRLWRVQRQGNEEGGP